MSSPTSARNATDIPLSHSQIIDALLSGSKWGAGLGAGVVLTYSFPWAAGNATFSGLNGSSYSTLHENTATYRYALDATQQASARAALQTWANVANIQFQETSDTATVVGDIRFAWTSATDGSGAWGWANFPNSHWPSGGDIWISSIGSGASDADWSAGSYNRHALIHEIGHALGLKHPFETTTLVSALLPASLDDQLHSVMSYTAPPKDLFRTLEYTQNSLTSLIEHVPCETPMVYDIAAIQYLYGANMNYRTGNDIYTFGTATPFFKTLWDAGGNDTISVSNFSENCQIDLTPGNYSSIRILSAPIPAGYTFAGGTMPTYDGTHNLGIAYGTTIENAVGGSGADILIGNTSNNLIRGNAGDDTIDGRAGIDTSTYTGNRASFTVTRSGAGFIVTDSSGVNGTDTLTNVERLSFSNAQIALDVAGGRAGTTAKILGAVFGAASVSNREYVGIGLDYLDSGMSYPDLMLLALNARLGAGFSNAAEVNLLYQNLVGVMPSAAKLNYYTGTIASGQFTQASLAVMAAELELNKTNVNLVGLAQTGLEFV